MKEFLQVEKIVSKEQPSKKEQELIDLIMTKKEESDSGDKSAATLCIKSSFEKQVESSVREASIFEKEVQTVKNKSYSSIQTDVSGCVSTVSTKNEKEFQSTKKYTELISIYGLLILFFTVAFCLMPKCFQNF